MSDYEAQSRHRLDVGKIERPDYRSASRVDPDCRKQHLGSLDGLPDEGCHTLHALHTDAENWYTGGEMAATSWYYSPAHAEESVENNVFNQASRQSTGESALVYLFYGHLLLVAREQ